MKAESIEPVACEYCDRHVPVSKVYYKGCAYEIVCDECIDKHYKKEPESEE